MRINLSDKQVELICEALEMLETDWCVQEGNHPDWFALQELHRKLVETQVRQGAKK